MAFRESLREQFCGILYGVRQLRRVLARTTTEVRFGSPSRGSRLLKDINDHSVNVAVA